MSDKPVVRVFWNPNASGAAANDALRATLEQRYSVHTTESPEHAAELARTAVADRMELVIIAGGDGAIHQTLSAMLSLQDASRPLPKIGLIPLGTGNDLCRGLDIPLDPLEALELIDDRYLLDLDVMKLSTPGSFTWCVNVASCGNSTRVSELLDDETKKRWGPWAYLRGAVPVLADLQAFPLEYQVNDSAWERVDAWNVVVANGRYVAGGIGVAPAARMNDGYFHVVIVLDGTPVDMTRLAVGLLAGDYLDDERVRSFQSKSLRLRLSDVATVLVDGERLDAREIEFTLHPRRLRVFAGENIPEREASEVVG